MENKLLKTPPRLFFQDGKDFETASPEKKNPNLQSRWLDCLSGKLRQDIYPAPHFLPFRHTYPRPDREKDIHP